MSVRERIRAATMVLAAVCLAVPVPAAAQETRGLQSLSLEELMAIPVTTVTRLPQARLQLPASVFVLTADDIRRSGAATLPEVLRLAPGLHVARIDGNKWAVGIRGFTDRLARGMLVLIDGRPVYSPLFAGTYWEVQNIPLGDIEQIEVVRGPGGALWGANAVTGIINIIRKQAATSAGWAATIAGGTQYPAIAELRYGGARGDRFQYRVSGRLEWRRPQDSAMGFDYDDGRTLQAGARADWQTARGDVTLQGDLYRTVIGQRDALVSYAPPARQSLVSDDVLAGGNVMLRWDGQGGVRAPRLQVFYDRTNRSELTFRERQDQADVDYQQGRQVGRHGILWGAGYRLIHGVTDTSGTLRFHPPDRTDHLATAFIQDDIRLVPDRLAAVVGTKVERNAYSGLEWQPSLRLQWTVTPANAVSVSVTRAVRTPSRVERDFESGNLLSPAVPSFIRLQPNPDFEPEELVAYEAGVVTMPHPRVLATVAVFRNTHDRVLSTELGTPFVETEGGRRLIVPVTFGNGLRGRSYGAELTADVRPADWWRTTAGYSWLRVELSRRPGSADLTQEARGEGGSPVHQVQVLTSLQLPGPVTVDWFVRHVSSLPDLEVSGYAESNVQVEWTIRDDLRLFAVGRNLHASSHVEFVDGANGAFAIRRGVLVGLRWVVRPVP